jgi:hypothetical protein
LGLSLDNLPAAFDQFLDGMTLGDIPDELDMDDASAWNAWLVAAFHRWCLETQLSELAAEGEAVSLPFVRANGKLARRWKLNGSADLFVER